MEYYKGTMRGMTFTETVRLGPAFIQASYPFAWDSEVHRVCHDVPPYGYVWKPATDWTAAGWVRT